MNDNEIIIDNVSMKIEEVLGKFENNKAYSEVYDIINHMEEDLYKMIPDKVIDYIKANRDYTHKVYFDYSKDISEQKMMLETKICLSKIYEKYILPEEQKQYMDIFQNKKEVEENASNKEPEVSNLVEEVHLVEIKKENIFIKIINFIKSKILKK